MQYWLVVHGTSDYKNRPDLVGFRHKVDSRGSPVVDNSGHETPMNRVVRQIRPHDLVAYYCKGEKEILGIFEIVRRTYQLHKDWRRSRVQFVIRPIIVPQRPLDFQGFVRNNWLRMNLFKDLKRWKDWGGRLQGKSTPKRLMPKDFRMLKRALGKQGEMGDLALLGVAPERWVGRLHGIAARQGSAWSPWTYQLSETQLKAIRARISSRGWVPLYLYQSKKSGGGMTAGYVGHGVEVKSSKTPVASPDPSSTPRGHQRERYRTWIRLDRIEPARGRFGYSHFKKWDDSGRVRSYELNRPYGYFICVHEMAESASSESDGRDVQRRRMTKEQFQEFLRRCSRVGRAGEKWVVQYERDQLEMQGRGDLARMVRLMDEDVGAGFDVLSYDTKGVEKYIEVKTTTTGGRAFEITANEWDTAKLHANRYWVYFVTSFRKGTNAIKIRNPASEEGKRLRLEPSRYCVTLD